MADLARQIQNQNMIVDYVYFKSIKNGKTIEIKKDIETNITGKYVLVIEEIIDEGKTLDFLLKEADGQPAGFFENGDSSR